MNLHKLLRRKHSDNYHLWDRDPNQELPAGTIFRKHTCVRCGYALDASHAQQQFRVAGMKIPGRVAEEDEW